MRGGLFYTSCNVSKNTNIVNREGGFNEKS